MIVGKPGYAVAGTGGGLMSESGTNGRNGGGADAASLPRWVWWLTGGWLAVLVALVAASEPCDALASYWRPDSRYLACLQANEVGDFLAGAFAPLAFLWLIATVVIQARELRAQRQELQLTRREFQANRKVAEAQATEAKRQAEFIGKQTDLLRDEQILNREMRADKEFDACIAAIARRALVSRGSAIATGTNGGAVAVFSVVLEAGSPLEDAIRALKDVGLAATALRKDSDLRLKRVSQAVETIIGLAKELVQLRSQVTPAKRVEARSLPLEDAIELEDLISERIGDNAQR